jgi:O-antigen/teichoic acid export membrane protein
MFAVMSFSMLLYFQSQTVIVSIMMGGAAVAIFSASRQLATLIRICIDTLCDASVPDICSLSVLDSLKPQVQRFRLLLGASIAITVSLGCFLWWEGGSIVELWTRHRLAPYPALIRLFVLLALGESVWLVAAVFRTALNQNRRTALFYALSNLSSVPLVIWLVPRFGSCAVPAGLLITETVFLWHPLLADTCRTLQLPYAKFAMKVWTFVLVAFGFNLLAGFAVHLLPVPAIVRWTISGTMGVVLACACTFLLWLGSEERDMVRSTLTRTLGARRAVAAIAS